MSSKLHRRAAIAGIAAAFAAPALAAAPAPARVTRIGLADAFLLLDSYLALKPAERDRFHFAYRTVRNGKPASDVQARIVHRDRTSTPLAVDGDGWVTELPTLEQLKARETFEVDGAPFDMAVELRAALAPDTRLPVSELDATLKQVNAAFLTFAEGDASQVGRLTCVYFPDAGAGHAILDGGAERPLPTFDFKLTGTTPYYDARARPSAIAVALDKPPSRILVAGRPRG
jgi:hypothetical protein